MDRITGRSTDDLSSRFAPLLSAAAQLTVSQNPQPTSEGAEAMAPFRKRDFGRAIAKYQEMLQQRPKSPDA
jgi:hypothetical protein